MTDIYKWSKTAANNDSADSGITWAEGQLPSSVNNSARAMMQRVAEWRDDISGTLTLTGTNTLTVTANSAFTAYATGRAVRAKAAATNTGTVTLNVNGIGAKNVYRNSPLGPGVLSAGDLVINGVYLFVYDAALNASAGGWIVEGISHPRAPVITTHTTSGTHTFQTDTAWYEVFVLGGGGAGGGVSGGTATTGCAAGGGNGGCFGHGRYAKAATTGTVTIGAGGTGSAGANGGAGGDSVWASGAVTITGTGGTGGIAMTTGTSTVLHTGGNATTAATGANILNGQSPRGTYGRSEKWSTTIINLSGQGGFMSGYGLGGLPVSHNTTGAAADTGNVGVGKGAGGAGAATANSTASRAGGAGSEGVIIVVEYS